MALLGSSLTSQVGLQVLLYPLGSRVLVRTACCSVGIALPIYSTFKAIERKDENQQQRWLLYWAAYGSFSLVEFFSDKLLSWFPMYYHMKFAFLVWLQLPSVEGARQLYMSYLRPFFLRRQARFDQVIDFTYDEMVKLISAHQAEIQFAKTLSVKIKATAEQMLKGVTGPVQSQVQTAIEGSDNGLSETESDHDE